MNKIIGKLMEYTKPFFTDSIVKRVGVETQFREGTVKTDFEIRFTPIKPYVEFVKRLDGNKVSSTKFVFRLDVNTYIKKLRIVGLHGGIKGDVRSIDIEKMGVQIDMYLEQTVAAATMPLLNYLNNPIKLGSKKFEIKNLSFHLPI
jgi:hypothetical protein